MSLYLKQAIFFNKAPFENLNLEFKEGETAILTALNGKGKTTILSHIADAFVEISKIAYRQEYEGKENKFFIVSESITAIDQSKPTFIYLRFIFEDNCIDYINFRSNSSNKELIEKCYDELEINGLTKPEFKSLTIGEKTNKKIILHNKSRKNKEEATASPNKSGKNKEKTITSPNKDTIEKLFNNNIVTYFPSYRYEKPAYLNEPYQTELSFAKEIKYVGFLKKPILNTSSLQKISNWMMDIVLDSQYHNATAQDYNEIIKSNPSILLHKESTGDQVVALNNHYSSTKNIKKAKIDEVVTKLINKNGKEFRVGVGKRNFGATRLQIIDKKDENGSLYPSIFYMSSGELSLLTLFGEILRQCDNIEINTDIGKIKGIVIIDEIDKHLHMELEFYVLPQLIGMFPKIQFILSTHSPFFPLGMQRSSNKHQVFDLKKKEIDKKINADEFYEKADLMKCYSKSHIISQKLKNLEEKDKNILIVEDKNTEIYKLAWLTLENISTTKEEINETFEQNCKEFIIISADGANNIESFFRDEQVLREFKDKKIIALFDFDEKGYQCFRNIGKQYFKKESNKITKEEKRKLPNANHTIALLPVSKEKNLEKYASLNFGKNSHIEIEHFLDWKFLKSSDNLKSQKTVGGGKIFEIKNKDKILGKILKRGKDEQKKIFKNFGHIFDMIKDITKDSQ